MGNELSVQVRCDTEKHGAWVICPSRQTIDSKTVVYSMGIGADASFDVSMIEKYGVKVFAFDPTPFSVEWVDKAKLSPQFCFYPFGVSGEDSLQTIYPPSRRHRRSYSVIQRTALRKELLPVKVQMHRLPTIMNMMGHKEIDILKMDIEGAEYDVIDDMVYNNIRPRQLLIEFHHFVAPLTYEDTLASIKKLNDFGYDIFWMSRRKKEFSFVLR